MIARADQSQILFGIHSQWVAPMSVFADVRRYGFSRLVASQLPSAVSDTLVR